MGHLHKYGLYEGLGLVELDSVMAQLGVELLIVTFAVQFHLALGFLVYVLWVTTVRA